MVRNCDNWQKLEIIIRLVRPVLWIHLCIMGCFSTGDALQVQISGVRQVYLVGISFVILRVIIREELPFWVGDWHPIKHTGIRVCQYVRVCVCGWMYACGCVDVSMYAGVDVCWCECVCTCVCVLACTRCEWSLNECTNIRTFVRMPKCSKIKLCSQMMYF